MEMKMNLSEKTIVTVLNGLRCARSDLRRQLREFDSEITRRQLHDVNDAIDAFEEFEDAIIARRIVERAMGGHDDN